MLIIDTEGTCTASSAAGDAGTDAYADAGLAGSSEQDATTTTKMNRTLYKLWELSDIFPQGQFSYRIQI
jgi:hypothetical protein